MVFADISRWAEVENSEQLSPKHKVLSLKAKISKCSFHSNTENLRDINSSSSAMTKTQYPLLFCLIRKMVNGEYPDIHMLNVSLFLPVQHFMAPFLQV